MCYFYHWNEILEIFFSQIYCILLSHFCHFCSKQKIYQRYWIPPRIFCLFLWKWNLTFYRTLFLFLVTIYFMVMLCPKCFVYYFLKSVIVCQVNFNFLVTENGFLMSLNVFLFLLQQKLGFRWWKTLLFVAFIPFNA